jgi:hypothetical protein
MLGQFAAAASIVARKVEAYLRIQVCGVHDGGRWLGGGRWRDDWRVSLLLGIGGRWFGRSTCQLRPQVGEEVGVGGRHRVGDEADVGGGGQHICVTEVTYVVWRQAVPFSDSYFRHKEAF